MTENRIKTYEKLLGYVLILAVILGIVSQLTGYGHTERHWEECTRFEYNNARKELGE